MTDADRQAFAGRIKRAVEAAAARGEHAYGYHFDGGHLQLFTRPADRRKRQPEAPKVAPTRRIVRRGAMQGTLL